MAEPLVALRRERNTFGRSPTFVFFLGERSSPLSTNVANKRKLSGGLCPPL